MKQAGPESDEYSAVLEWTIRTSSNPWERASARFLLALDRASGEREFLDEQIAAVTPPASYVVSTVRRRRRKAGATLPTIATPQDVYRLVHGLVRHAEQEQFYCLYLNARNAVTRLELVSIGTVNASLVHPREVFRLALQEASCAVVLAHNHPSGDCTPSEDDVSITRRLVSAGEILGISVLDHVVLANGDFRSFKEARLL